jgi:23S rRNA (cytidine1920-2'-O)/16S rRNA (cytidine1409-2'-O)-methyltransferase
MTKRRVDTLLVDRGLAESRAKAQALVLAGQVRSGERPVAKPGMLVEETLPLDVQRGPRYVSRGGEKLDRALAAFGLDVTGLVCADAGSSTGGFTDCLLQHGASRVYAIDVGKGQLDYRLRNDARVAVMEEKNVRALAALPEPVDFVTTDVSFISLRLVLPVIAAWFDDNRRGERPFASTPASGSIVALFKPQFEAEKDEVPRGGVIRDPTLHSTLIGRFAAWCVRNGFRVLDLTASPILGAEGNREFLFRLRPPALLPPAGEAGGDSTHHFPLFTPHSEVGATGRGKSARGAGDRHE